MENVKGFKYFPKVLFFPSQVLKANWVTLKQCMFTSDLFSCRHLKNSVTVQLLKISYGPELHLERFISCKNLHSKKLSFTVYLHPAKTVVETQCAACCYELADYEV